MNWYLSLPPADAVVPCGNGSHTVRWEAGQLTLPGHPDAGAELVLGALGGGKPECVALFEKWSRHADDLAVLAAGPRSPADQVTVTREQVEQQRAQRIVTARASVLRRPAAMMMGRASGEDFLKRAQQRFEVLELLALGPAFQFRLSGEVAAAWASSARAGDRETHRPALAAALAGRFAPAAAQWLDIDPDEVTVTPHEGRGWGTLTAAGAGTVPGDAGHLWASLPVNWLCDVWACGLAVIDAHLIVGVEEPGYPHARVLALRAPGAEPAVLDVEAADPEPDAAGALARWSVSPTGREPKEHPSGQGEPK